MSKKHVKLTVEQFEALMVAGSKCSNVCYNLAQSEELRQDTRDSAHESRKEWDAAANAARKQAKP